MENPTQEGMNALKSGNKSLARILFRKAIQQNHNDVQAWLGLASSVETDIEKVQCLQTAINIDPENNVAKTALDQVTRSMFPDANSKVQKPLVEPSSNPFSISPTEVATPDTLKSKRRPIGPIPRESGMDESFELLRTTFTTTDAPSIEGVAVPKMHQTSQNESPTGETIINDEPEAPYFNEDEETEIDNSPRIPQSIFLFGGLGALFVCVLLVGLTVFLLQYNHILGNTSPNLMSVAKPILAEDLTQTANAAPKITVLPTQTSEPTIRPTSTQIPTPTFASANQTVQNRFDKIQAQVADLRGLDIKNANVPVYPITKSQAKEYFSRSISSDEFVRSLEYRKQALVLLGFVKPTFDMLTEVINHSVDNLGGFYVPGSSEIFIVVNTRVGGLEYLVYSHEFDHALVDQHFNIKDVGVYPDCNYDSQRCRAIEALIEGDATLLMEQWALQYFTQKDYIEAITAPEPFYVPEDESIPPYLSQDALFPYYYGRLFVKNYFKAGNWASVNKLYDRLPLSTEQIMNWNKYNNNEAPIDLPDEKIMDVIGENWERIETDVLGEWMTYLMLAYNADIQSQVNSQLAKTAAAGWGGDHYQVFRNKSDGSTALAAHWVWDTDPDVGEFYNAMSLSLEKRFRGNHVDVKEVNKKCWNTLDQYSCLYVHNRHVLWLLAPYEKQIDIMLKGYPEFDR